MARLLFDHFIVLMLENRSFDHLFGYLGIGDGIPQGGQRITAIPAMSRARSLVRGSAAITPRSVKAIA